MKFFHFLVSKTLWVNVLIAGILAAGLLWGISSWLDDYTRHRQSLTVPNLETLALPEVEERLERLHLDYSVIDSATYNPDYPRGAVVDHYPRAGAKVKEGREIKLTVNPRQPRKIAIAGLKEKTKRRAIYDLESKGFEVGELRYVPYIGKDVVVRLKVNGKVVKSGDKFEKGTTVDLILGKGLGENRIRAPNLHWLNAEEARSKLKDRSLNLGSVIYDDATQDSSLALVYRQSPPPSNKKSIRPGSEVDIWLTENYTKIKTDSLEYQSRRRDSIQNATP